MSSIDNQRDEESWSEDDSCSEYGEEEDPIRLMANDCNDLFDNSLARTADSDRPLPPLALRFFRNYSRNFRRWCRLTCVIAENENDSLDYRLRNNSTLLDSVLRLLDILHYSLLFVDRSEVQGDGHDSCNNETELPSFLQVAFHGIKNSLHRLHKLVHQLDLKYGTPLKGPMPLRDEGHIAHAADFPNSNHPLAGTWKRPEFVVLKHQAWLDAAEFEDKILDSVVQDFLSPTDNFLPDEPLQYNKHEFEEGSSFHCVLHKIHARTHEPPLKVKSIAGFRLKGDIESTLHLSGKLIRYRCLQEHEQFWLKLKENDDFKLFVPRWTSRSNPPVCLVVGIMTCEDVEYSYEGKDSVEREGNIESPICTVTTLPAGAPNPGGNSVDPRGNVANNRHTVTVFEAKKREAKIFALELKKIYTKAWIQEDLDPRDGRSEPLWRSDPYSSGRLWKNPWGRPNVEDLVLTDLSQKDHEEFEKVL